MFSETICIFRNNFEISAFQMFVFMISEQLELTPLIANPVYSYMIALKSI